MVGEIEVWGGEGTFLRFFDGSEIVVFSISIFESLVCIGFCVELFVFISFFIFRIILRDSFIIIRIF